MKYKSPIGPHFTRDQYAIPPPRAPVAHEGRLQYGAKKGSYLTTPHPAAPLVVDFSPNRKSRTGGVARLAKIVILPQHSDSRSATSTMYR